MTKKIIYLTLLTVTSFGAWFFHTNYGGSASLRAFQTFASLAVIYFVFQITLRGVVVKRIRDSRARHSVRKAISLVGLAVAVIAVLRIWVDDPQALIVSYGLVGAGMAIALQDFFKNFASGLVLFVGGSYGVGDRIEVDGTHGDVIDIGLLYTTLLEIKGWVDGDQPTGRMTLIPNGKILSNTVQNYSRDHNFIWDELAIPITYESDWQKARDIFTDIVTEETEEVGKRAGNTLSELRNKYYIAERETKPKVYMRLTDNWILMSVRYVTEVKKRRAIQDKLGRLFLKAIEKEDSIDIASENIIIEQNK